MNPLSNETRPEQGLHMQPIQEIHHEWGGWGKIKKGIEKVNNLINQYNTAVDKPEKLQVLYEIYQERKRIDNLLPVGDIADSQYSSDDLLDYRNKFYHSLFKELKEQFKNLGVISLNEASLKESLRSDSHYIPDSSTLPEILANMAPEKANLMAKILLDKRSFGDRVEMLKNLFLANEPEYENFNAFMTEHTIEIISDRGNSRNFKFRNIDSGDVFVLKLDNRMLESKVVDGRLREGALEKYVTPIMVERSVDISTGTRTLLLTEYCPGGSLLSHQKRQTGEKEKLKSALIIYRQMADILEEIRTNGYAFIDMKNSNWLMDDNDRLRISDTKSFVFTDTEQVSDPEVHSTNFQPPEFSSTKEFPADTMHSYILGKNLYQYLIGPVAFSLEMEGLCSNLDFSADVFKTEQGQLLKTLIQSMIKPDFNDRISVAEARSQLVFIDNIENIRSCNVALQELKNYKFGKNDSYMNAFIQEKQEDISKAETTKEYSDIQNNIKLRLNDWSTSTGVQEVQNAINSLRERANLWAKIASAEKPNRIDQVIRKVPLAVQEMQNTMSSMRERVRVWARRMEEKADRIEQAMCKIPLEQRGDININQINEAHEKTQEMHSDETMATSIVKTFKEAIANQRKDGIELQEENTSDIKRNL